jgi:hypothetical protein
MTWSRYQACKLGVGGNKTARLVTAVLLRAADSLRSAGGDGDTWCCTALVS